MNSEVFTIGEVVLNTGTQEVTLDGSPVALPPLSFNLLLTLARHAPNVVTTRQLEKEVWEGLVVDRGTINKRVLLVRKALKEAGCQEDYIGVVRGTGYRLLVPVERFPKEDDVRTAATPNDRARQRSLLQTWGSMLLVLLAALLSYSMRDHTGNPDATVGSAHAPTAQIRSRGHRFGGHTHSPTLAVLPFVDSSANPEDNYLGDGIAQEIITILSGLEGLSVAASTSSFAFRDYEEPPSSVAAQLGVDSVLRGSILREGSQIRLDVELIGAYAGSTLWSGSYERQLEDLLDLQEEIAFNVARGLEVSVSNRERPRARSERTGDLAAFSDYLKARALQDERLHRGAEGVAEALDLFMKAAEADPGFVRAHVGIASSYFLLPAYDASLDPQHYYELAEASARNALQLDPTSPGALGVLAAVLASRGEPARAASLFRQAQDLGNRDSNITHWQARLFTSMGYFDEQVEILREAHRLDPLNVYVRSSLAIALSLDGDAHAAIDVLSEMDAFATRDYILAVAQLHLGRFAQARSLLRGLEVASGRLPPTYADLVVDAIEDPGKRPASESAILTAAREGMLPAPVAFESLLLIGSPRAFELEFDVSGTDLEYRLPEPAWVNWGVDLRRDPRFKSWIRTLGYDRYWRKNGWPDRCRPTSLDDFECV